MTRAGGSAAQIEDLRKTLQTLDLRTGLLSSQFELDGRVVWVQTVCHPARDILAVRVESSLLEQKRLTVSLAFPYGSLDWRNSADWSNPERHTTQAQINNKKAEFIRILDSDRYYVTAVCSDGADVRVLSQHQYHINRTNGESLEIVFAFSPDKIIELLPDFNEVRTAAANHWQRFWNTGGAIDFSLCTDPRARELERRIVLSQYLTAIQCAGSRPPQETGLVCNSWNGKFHLEMHWWHAVHFALWNRLELLERSLPWYQSILPAAKATARVPAPASPDASRGGGQGYQGVRWPKMTSPDGRESPSNVGVFLIWQQPHPIYYAELCYRAHKDRQTLEKYRQIVFETAEFMASYPVWDQQKGRYVLGPAVIPAQESHGPQRRQNLNPTFELAYWRWGLETAQKWRERLDIERDPKWDHVIDHLSRPHILGGIYTGIETPPHTICRDHPSMVAAFGLVPPGPFIDAETMRRTRYCQMLWMRFFDSRAEPLRGLF